jgi:Na+/proline symporter
VNALYTWFLWVSAVCFVSASIQVWTVPTMFKGLPTQNPRRMRHQALWSVISFALAAFCIFYAFTQYPDIRRSWGDVVPAGLVTLTLVLTAISGWIRTAIRAVGMVANTTQGQDAV